MLQIALCRLGQLAWSLVTHRCAPAVGVIAGAHETGQAACIQQTLATSRHAMIVLDRGARLPRVRQARPQRSQVAVCVRIVVDFISADGAAPSVGGRGLVRVRPGFGFHVVL